MTEGRKEGGRDGGREGGNEGGWLILLLLYAHTGSSNAYTDTEDTVYYFDVDAKFLEVRMARKERREEGLTNFLMSLTRMLCTYLPTGRP